jgi:low affinity Fe/Cu permease
MNGFDRFADRVAHVWEKPWWFAICAAFVIGWVSGLLATRQWNDSAYHLWLNSPTTALTFLGVFLLHNSTQRFERATNKRLEQIITAVCGEDPVTDEGQKSGPDGPDGDGNSEGE